MDSAEAVRQKELGAFYTPRAMAEKLVEWAVTSPDDTVLDPSFGGLVFLEAAAARLAELGCAADQIATQIHGIELDEEAFGAASRSNALGSANLTQGDFFSIMPDSQAPLCRAVVGNPPYVRYQGFNGHGHAGHKLAAAAGVPLTRLASSWAPFVIHAVSFLEAGGRLALVLPAEVIHAQYAGPVLEFLRRNFARVELAVFEERIFPGALEEVVLLFADDSGEGPAPQIEMFPASRLKAFALGDGNELSKRAEPPDGNSFWLSCSLLRRKSSIGSSLRTKR